MSGRRRSDNRPGRSTGPVWPDRPCGYALPVGTQESGASPERSRHCQRPSIDVVRSRTVRESGTAPGDKDQWLARTGVGSRDKKGAALRFPFSAVLGQDALALALILNAVHPAVGGVLVRGEKGTAKSTMVRALAAVLPAVDAVPGCRFSCDPASPDPACPDGPHPGAEAATRPARLVE